MIQKIDRRLDEESNGLMDAPNSKANNESARLTHPSKFIIVYRCYRELIFHSRELIRDIVYIVARGQRDN